MFWIIWANEHTSKDRTHGVIMKEPDPMKVYKYTGFFWSHVVCMIYFVGEYSIFVDN